MFWLWAGLNLILGGLYSQKYKNKTRYAGPPHNRGSKLSSTLLQSKINLEKRVLAIQKADVLFAARFMSLNVDTGITWVPTLNDIHLSTLTDKIALLPFPWDKSGENIWRKLLDVKWPTLYVWLRTCSTLAANSRCLPVSTLKDVLFFRNLDFKDGRVF